MIASLPFFGVVTDKQLNKIINERLNMSQDVLPHWLSKWF